MLKAPEIDRGPRFTGTIKSVVMGVAVVTSVYHLLYAGAFFNLVGIYITPGTHRGISFSLVIILTFLLMPATKRHLRDQVPWYDVIIILLGLLPSLYFAINYTKIVRLSFIANTFEAFLGFTLVLAILEAARRTIGLVLTVIGLVFLVYPFVSQYMPGLLQARPHSFTRIMEVVYFYPDGVFGGIYHAVATVVIVYIIFGGFLRVSGAGKFFIDLAVSVMGTFRGGPAKVAVVSSAFFASISGSAMANVASTGVITIPMMKNTGYKPHFAAAVEAVASTGGPLTPPVMGSVAFLMAEFLDIPYLNVMVAAILPALLYYLAVYVMVDIEAVKTGLKGLPREQIPPIRGTIKRGWPFFLPLIILIFFLAIMRYSAQTAGIYAIVATILISWLRRDTRMGPKRILQALAEGTEGIPATAAAVMVAGIIMGGFAVTGLNLTLGGTIVNLFGGNMALLLVVTAIFCYILGMAETSAAVYLIAVILMVPALTLAGLSPLVGHFFVFLAARAALITPPVCIVSYLAASIAGASFWRTGFESMRLGAVLFILPFIIAYSPELLTIGSPIGIAQASITAIIGVIFLSLGLQGYFLKRVSWVERALLLAGGLALIVPGGLSDGIGLACGASPILWQTIRSKLAQHRV